MLLASGCAMVEETRSDGTLRRSFALFTPVTVIRVGPDAARVLRVTSIGATIAGDTNGIGFTRTELVLLDPSCRIVLIGATDAQIATLASLLGEHSHVCNELGPEGENYAANR